MLPPDPDGMNDKRAEWARAALKTFTKQTRQTCEHEALGDLMVDLLHLADRMDRDPMQLLASAQASYAKETYKEEETCLRELCKQTDTQEDDWESIDGIPTGVGVESWFRHKKDGREAYCVDDQGDICVSVGE